MKSLTGALVALAVGAGLGLAVVAGASAIINPDKTVVEQSSDSPVDVLRYGNRG
jgi:hypothetical protein